MILWALLSFVISFLLLPVARTVAVKYNFTDTADYFRKFHQGAVPPIGGLIIIPVFAMVSILAGLNISEHAYFLAALALVWITGGVDDKYYLSSGLRLCIQLLAAFLLVVGNHTTVYYLGDLLGNGHIATHPVSILFSILCVTLVINAINMIDGMNGLCGGVLAIMLMALICASMMAGGHEMVAPMFILLGSLAGFLFYNYRYKRFDKKCLFMGDSGSTALGLILSWMVIELTQNVSNAGPGLLEPVLIVWILALPVFDAISLFAYRLLSGQSPFKGDRNHMHHLISRQGISEKNTVNIIHYMTLFYAAFGVIAIQLLEIQVAYLVPLWLAFFVLHNAITLGLFKGTLRKIVSTY